MKNNLVITSRLTKQPLAVIKVTGEHFGSDVLQDYARWSGIPANTITYHWCPIVSYDYIKEQVSKE
jgi:hypothetical protein